MPVKQWRIAIHDFTEAGAPEYVATAVREVRAHLSNLLTAAGHLITLDNADLIYELLGSPSAEGGELTKLEVDVRRDADTVGDGTYVIGEGWDNVYRVAASEVRVLTEYIERQNAEAEGASSPRVFAAPKTGDSIGTMVKMPGGEYRQVSISGTQATIWGVNDEAAWRPTAVDISGILDEFGRSDDYQVDSFVVPDGVGLLDFPAWLRQSLNQRSTVAHAGLAEGVGKAGDAAISLIPRTRLTDAEAAQFSRSIEPFLGMVETRLQDGSLGEYAEARARHELAAIRAEQYGNPAGPTPGVLRIHAAKLIVIVLPPGEAELVEAGVSQDAAQELGAAVLAAV